MTELHLFFLIAFIGLTYSVDIVIHENELSNDMEEHAIGKALLAFEELKTDKLVAKYLTNEMNIRFGKQLMCFVGMSYNPVFDVEHQIKNLIWFSYKQKPISLFKQQSHQ
jgi:hypothetical protein